MAWFTLPPLKALILDAYRSDYDDWSQACDDMALWTEIYETFLLQTLQMLLDSK
jgi:hypothetical protein